MTSDSVTPVVRRRRNYGNQYNGLKKGEKPKGRNGQPVPNGTVVVRSEGPEPRNLPVSSRARRVKREVPGGISRECYSHPKPVTLRRREVTRAFDFFKNRKRDFRTSLVARFVEAVRARFRQDSEDQCRVEIWGKWVYEMDPTLGAFLEVRIGKDEFTVPKSFFDPRPEVTTSWRKPKVSKKK